MPPVHISDVFISENIVFDWEFHYGAVRSHLTFVNFAKVPRVETFSSTPNL